MNIYLFYILFAIGALVIYTGVAIAWMGWLQRRENPRTVWGHARRAQRLARRGRTVTLVAEFCYWNGRNIRAAQYGLFDQDLAWANTDAYWRALRSLGLEEAEIHSIAKREMLYR